MSELRRDRGISRLAVAPPVLLPGESRLSGARHGRPGRRSQREENVMELLLISLKEHAVLLGSALTLATVWFVVRLGMVVIRENESGLVIKKFGAVAAARAPDRARRRGRLPGRHAAARLALRAVALEVQGGARCRWWWCGRGRSRWWWPPTATRFPSERILGQEVECDDFQNARAVPRERRREGPAARLPDRGHVPHQPGALPGGHHRQRRATSACGASELLVFEVPPDKVGIVTTLDGKPIVPGRPGRAGGGRARQLPARARRSSTRAAAAACRSRCCCPARGT